MPGRRRRTGPAGGRRAGLLAPPALTASATADNDAGGCPLFSGSSEPVPESPAGLTVRNTVRARYEAGPKYAEPGTFEAGGAVEGTTRRATATVTVVNPSSEGAS